MTIVNQIVIVIGWAFIGLIVALLILWRGIRRAKKRAAAAGRPWPTRTTRPDRPLIRRTPTGRADGE